jgi:hypothetical protein
MKRGYIQVSFGWLFAIIVGGIILLLAILFATRLINIERTAGGAETGKEIGILLSPLETSFESSKTTSISIARETRIYNKCSKEGFFGKQIIQTSQKSFNKWGEIGVDASFENKYIFSKKEAEGKVFYIFSKSFEFPFKVADLIYLTSASEKYCFVNTPKEIKDELSELGQKNLLFENCYKEGINVCFSSEPNTDCDINVNYNDRYVLKGKDALYFEGDALMYAAIFSDSGIYECQVGRLMKRIEQLSLLYREKEKMIPKECESDLGSLLLDMSNIAKSFDDIGLLDDVKDISNSLENKNEISACSLW